MNETASGQTTPFEWAGPRRTIAASERDGRHLMLSRPRRRCRRMPNRSHAHKLVSTRRRALSPNAEIFTQNRKKTRKRFTRLAAEPQSSVHSSYSRRTQQGTPSARIYIYIYRKRRACLCLWLCLCLCVCV